MDKLYSIRSSLEKILKAILIKLENGDELSVSSELVWFDDLIERIYNLLDSHPQLFQKIVDPFKRFRYVDAIDPRKIDWSKVKLKENKNISNKSYPINVIESQYDILDSFFSFSIRVWEAGIKYDRFEVSKRALYSIGNLYGVIFKRLDQSKHFNYISYYSFFCQKINGKLISLLAKKSYSNDNASLINFLSFHFHLDHFSQNEFPKEKSEILSSSIFINLKLCVDTGQFQFINNFVRSSSHRNLLPLWPDEVTKLEILVYERLKGKDTEPILSKKVNNLVSVQVGEIFTKKEYHELSKKLVLLKKEIINTIGFLTKSDSISIEKYIKEIVKYSYQRHKYKLVQRALNNTLIYCIFKKEYTTVDFAFQFHRPADRDGTWANDDIIFDDLFDILKYISLRWDIENELTFIWPDHHGSPIYIDIFFVGLLDRWVKYHYHHADKKIIISAYTQRLINSEKNKGRDNLLSWVQEFKEILFIAKGLHESKQWPFGNGHNDKFNKFNETVEQILSQFNNEYNSSSNK